MVLKSDPNVVVIALNNILENAIKFSNEDSQIRIEANEQKTFVKLSVIDSGVGMNPEKLESLIGGNVKSTAGTAGEIGKGYGLKAIQELIDLVGAFMEIESEINQGTTVSLFFPKWDD